MKIGPFAGLIYTVILIVDCLFFLILEWSMPREDLHFVRLHWDHEYFVEVRDILQGCSHGIHRLAFSLPRRQRGNRPQELRWSKPQACRRIVATPFRIFYTD
jgi:hypothetical protein